MNRDYFSNSYYLSRKPMMDEMDEVQENMPTIPLPNEGEGGAVYPGDEEEGATPVTPLPNVGEGGAVYPGNTNMPSSPVMPNAPSMPGRPTTPNMPAPEENRPPMTGNIAGIIGTIISSHPRPNEPCRFCAPNMTRTGMIRFLNAATGYNPFVIFVNENEFSESLNFGELTDYAEVSAGNLTVTVMGENGYIFMQKKIEVMLDDIMTLAIVNTDSGLDLEMIMDEGCTRGSNLACIRAANLAYNSGNLSVNIGNQRVNFPNLRYRAVANFEQIWPGMYVYTVSREGTSRMPGGLSNLLLAAPLNVQADRNYTIFLLNWKTNSTDSVRALVVEDM